MAGTGAHPRALPPDQRPGALLTHLTSPPHPGGAQQGERHPDQAPLTRDASRIGLPLAAVPRWLAQLCLDGLALAASPGPPRRDRPLVEPQGPHQGVHRTAMGAHREEQRPKVARRAQAGKAGPDVAAKGVRHGVQRKRLSLRAWMPIVPWPVWPLAGHASVGQPVVVGAMLVLPGALGNVPRGGGLDPRWPYKDTPPRLAVELPGVD